MLKVMFLILMTLKLTGHFQGSWFWVAAPLLVNGALSLLGVVLEEIAEKNKPWSQRLK